MLESLTKDEDSYIQMPMLARQIETAQKRCEDNNYQRRKYVLNYDDVMNKQRQLIYTQRNEVLGGKDVHDQVLKYLEPISDEIVSTFMNFDPEEQDEVDVASFNAQLELKLLRKGTNLITEELLAENVPQKVEAIVYETAVAQYEEKVAFAKENGIDFTVTERNVLLNQVDKHWMNHIANMDALRKGIGLRGYGQRDPVMEYRREGTDMFDEMIESIQNSTALILAKLDVETYVERRNAFQAMQQRRVTVVNKDPNKSVGRNDPCPCGSGKKYKNCCGRNA